MPDDSAENDALHAHLADTRRQTTRRRSTVEVPASVLDITARSTARRRAAFAALAAHLKANIADRGDTFETTIIFRKGAHEGDFSSITLWDKSRNEVEKKIGAVLEWLFDLKNCAALYRHFLELRNRGLASDCEVAGTFFDEHGAAHQADFAGVV